MNRAMKDDSNKNLLMMSLVQVCVYRATSKEGDTALMIICFGEGYSNLSDIGEILVRAGETL
jgi:hypothetical protein